MNSVTSGSIFYTFDVCISHSYYFCVWFMHYVSFNIVVVLSRIFQVVTVVIYDYFCIGFMLSHYFP